MIALPLKHEKIVLQQPLPINPLSEQFVLNSPATIADDNEYAVFTLPAPIKPQSLYYY